MNVVLKFIYFLKPIDLKVVWHEQQSLEECLQVITDCVNLCWAVILYI